MQIILHSDECYEENKAGQWNRSDSWHEAILVYVVREDISKELTFVPWITWCKEDNYVKVWGKSIPDWGTSTAEALRQERAWPVWEIFWSRVEYARWNEASLERQVGTDSCRALLAMVRNLDFNLNAEGCYLETFKQKNGMMWSGLFFLKIILASVYRMGCGLGQGNSKGDHLYVQGWWRQVESRDDFGGRVNWACWCGRTGEVGMC